MLGSLTRAFFSRRDRERRVSSSPTRSTACLAMPSGSSSRAWARWCGVICWFPASVADSAALFRASDTFCVNLEGSIATDRAGRGCGGGGARRVTPRGRGWGEGEGGAGAWGEAASGRSRPERLLAPSRSFKITLGPGPPLHLSPSRPPSPPSLPSPRSLLFSPPSLLLSLPLSFSPSLPPSLPFSLSPSLPFSLSPPPSPHLPLNLPLLLISSLLLSTNSKALPGPP